ncbi:MAG: hypothetical protein R3C14_31345 [Caldilineaceae bacterium]
MDDKKSNNDQVKKNKAPPHPIRLPGFITMEEVGLGDVIKRATHAFGIKPCGGCEHRAAALNRWFVFMPPVQ